MFQSWFNLAIATWARGRYVMILFSEISTPGRVRSYCYHYAYNLQGMYWIYTYVMHAVLGCALFFLLIYSCPRAEKLWNNWNWTVFPWNLIVLNSISKGICVDFTMWFSNGCCGFQRFLCECRGLLEERQFSCFHFGRRPPRFFSVFACYWRHRAAKFAGARFSAYCLVLNTGQFPVWGSENSGRRARMRW